MGAVRVSRTAKIAYFFLAIATMACFAAGSACLALEQGAWAAAWFVLAVALAAAGFIAKRRILKRPR